MNTNNKRKLVETVFDCNEQFNKVKKLKFTFPKHFIQNVQNSSRQELEYENKIAEIKKKYLTDLFHQFALLISSLLMKSSNQ